MKRAVISGATGAIGMALIQKLIEEGTEILVLCRKGSERSGRLPGHPLVTVCNVDLEEYGGLRNETDKSWDIFYHLAWSGTIGTARNDTDLQMKNVSYTLDAVRLAKRFGCHTFIGAGSQAEYGRWEGALNEKTPAFPENGYGIAKLCAGQMSRLLCSQLELRHIWVRILSVYGPCDGKQSMIMSAIRKLIDGERPVFTPGEQKWDYLYAADAAKALFLLGEKGIDRKVYCLGSGEAKPLREYIIQLRDAVNPEAPIGLGDIPYSAGQVMYLCADLEDLQKDTGFTTDYSFERGIRETVQYVRNEG